MTIITLLTDFGDKDGFTGMMKGVILSIAPDVHIVDLTHQVEPQAIRQGAFLLSQAVPFFPAGTIHLAVVDPGVGTDRRPMALRLGDQTFVGPDNGLFTLVIQNASAQGFPLQAVVLDRPEFWLPEVSNSFHGRDLFAPVAAHLAKGWRLSDVGSPLPEPVRLSFPLPQPVEDGWRGEIMTIDHFGNLITNLSPNHIPTGEGVCVTVGESVIRGIARTFGEHDPGELITMTDSSGYLSIAVVNGNAASRLNAHIGDAVLLAPEPSKHTPGG